MKANDADDGVNGQIKYAISSGIKKEHFAIDSDSGLITSASKLDYETKKSYNLTVTGNDQIKARLEHLELPAISKQRKKSKLLFCQKIAHNV